MAERAEFSFMQAERGLAGSVLLDTDARFWPEARELAHQASLRRQSAEIGMALHLHCQTVQTR